tara:strand:- start:2906 stop:3349 length:444 start_codon:yes stop_codon:yes gene_type:complete
VKTQVNYGEWLGQFDWQWFVTLTFRHDPPKPLTALRKYRRWEKSNDLFFPSNPYSFIATEDGSKFGRLHLHSLVGGQGMGQPKAAWQSWFRDPFGGRARIESYDPKKGASFYISKYVTKSLGEWEVLGEWPILENTAVRSQGGKNRH